MANAKKVVKHNQAAHNPYEKLQEKGSPESLRPSVENKPNKPKLPLRTEFTIFARSTDYESRIRPREIQELLSQVQMELKSLKAASTAIASNIRGVERLTIDKLSDKPGVYHSRFLELIISYLRDIRKKVGEANTWMEALQSKKAKRGSLFAARSKKQGTAYSMSQEHSIVRQTQ